MLTDRIKAVKDRIAEAEQRRPPGLGPVSLVAISKMVPVECIQEAASCGLAIFGENYVQEAERKIAVLRSNFPELASRLSFHLTGPLQRNKAKKAVTLFDLIQTVDRLDLVKELARQLTPLARRIKVLVQVNISTEPTKSGVSSDGALSLCECILQYPELELCGLMSIGSFDAPITTRRMEFAKTRELRDRLAQQIAHPLPELSMGMSEDFFEAILEGATIVRVGSALFGQRIKAA